MSVLNSLKPTKKHSVMELVQSAGVNVSDWSNMKSRNISTASNPKYCNRWSFLQPGKVVVLNYWYNQIKETKGKLQISSLVERMLRSSKKKN